jgi:dCMP deaminase
MKMAVEQAKRTNCSRREVGAVLVTVGGTLAGCNSSPESLGSCKDGACPRCSSDAPSLSGYDWCVCVHAEELVLGACANLGLVAAGGILYMTLQPCLTCLKLIVVAGVNQLYWLENFPMSTEAAAAWAQFADFIQDARQVTDEGFEAVPLWAAGVGQDYTIGTDSDVAAGAWPI